MAYKIVVKMGGSYYRFLVLKETEKDSFIKEILPDELAKLEKLLISRNGGEGFVLGDKVSLQQNQ